MRRGLGARTCARAHISAAIGVALLAGAPSAAAAGDCAHADSAPGSARATELSAATLCLVNQERAAAGMGPLTASAPLVRTAQGYAGEMVATLHFAHSDTSGRSVAGRLAATGSSLEPWLELGENLGWGSLDQATPRAIVAGWMRSPSHRDNVLYPPFDSLGVGVADGAPAPVQASALTYVAVFGDRHQPRRPAKPRSRCDRARTRARARACRARELRSRLTKARGTRRAPTSR